jgi:hypothetical protein
MESPINTTRFSLVAGGSVFLFTASYLLMLAQSCALATPIAKTRIKRDSILFVIITIILINANLRKLLAVWVINFQQCLSVRQ